jgi:hypothetical protein
MDFSQTSCSDARTTLEEEPRLLAFQKVNVSTDAKLNRFGDWFVDGFSWGPLGVGVTATEGLLTGIPTATKLPSAG